MNKPQEVEQKPAEHVKAKQSDIGGFLNKLKKNQPQALPNKDKDFSDQLIKPDIKIEETIFPEAPKITEEIEVKIFKD